mmetsp:Transcript_39353/g.92223  ORF Transcript_39353/g.92223 Transcript_39353/m.92223 type:complete len:93 (+) Transcript_39353:142-420(+)
MDQGSPFREPNGTLEVYVGCARVCAFPVQILVVARSLPTWFSTAVEHVRGFAISWDMECQADGGSDSVWHRQVFPHALETAQQSEVGSELVH